MGQQWVKAAASGGEVGVGQLALSSCLALPLLSQLSWTQHREAGLSADPTLPCRTPSPSRVEAHQNLSGTLKARAVWVWGLQLPPGQGDGISGGEVCRVPWDISLCAVNKNAAGSF